MDDRYTDILASLAAEDNLRKLRELTPDGKYILHKGERYLNLSSNDYLGIGSDTVLQEEFFASVGVPDRFVMGNPSSRLMTGNSPEYDLLEKKIAELYGEGRECLLFGSGYLANSAVLRAITMPGDVILADRLVHASIVDGVMLSGRSWERFRHNDAAHLEKLIVKHRARGCGKIWVVTESIFSMDGDRAPLRDICGLKKQYGLGLYLDEAHAFGVVGTEGAGLASALGLDADFDIIIGTLGKAAAGQGGFAVCTAEMRQVLINKARGLIFSTALPPWSLMWSAFVIGKFPEIADRRKKLESLARIIAPEGREPSHIVPVMAYGNGEADRLANKLRKEGYWVTPIRYPTVPKGEARVRLSLTAAMELEEIEKLAALCRSIG